MLFERWLEARLYRKQKSVIDTHLLLTGPTILWHKEPAFLPCRTVNGRFQAMGRCRSRRRWNELVSRGMNCCKITSFENIRPNTKRMPTWVLGRWRAIPCGHFLNTTPRKIYANGWLAFCASRSYLCGRGGLRICPYVSFLALEALPSKNREEQPTIRWSYQRHWKQTHSERVWMIRWNPVLLWNGLMFRRETDVNYGEMSTEILALGCRCNGRFETSRQLRRVQRFSNLGAVLNHDWLESGFFDN